MPGCLGLDALWQLTGFFLGWLGPAGQRARARRRRSEIRRSGAPFRQARDLRRRRSNASSRASSCSASPTVGWKPTASAYMTCGTCALACSAPPKPRKLNPLAVRPRPIAPCGEPSGVCDETCRRHRYGGLSLPSATTHRKCSPACMREGPASRAPKNTPNSDSAARCRPPRRSMRKRSSTAARCGSSAAAPRGTMSRWIRRSATPAWRESDISNVRTGLIMGSGGPSTRTIVEAADITRSKGPKRVGPFAVPKAMSSSASATFVDPGSRSRASIIRSRRPARPRTIASAPPSK